MNLVEFNNVSMGYENKNIINDLSFNISYKDFILVIGSNGAGKSTLIKGLVGINKVKSGDIKYLINKSEIGYMMQDLIIDNNFPLTVEEFVRGGLVSKLKHKFFYTKRQKTKVLEVLMELKILDLRRKSISEISGGERQKAMLARILVSDSKLLVLDEPSNNLDVESKKWLYKFLNHLNDKHDITIIMITHDSDIELLNYSKVIALKDGAISLEERGELNA